MARGAGPGVRRPASPRRSAGRVAALALVALAAAAGLPLAADGPAPSPGLPPGPEEARSFGLGDPRSAFGPCPDGAPRPFEPDAGRLTLGPALLAAGGPAAAALPALRDPREPLRGVRNAAAPASKRFWRGMLIITGTEIAAGVALSFMPKTNTNWDDDPFSRAGQNFTRAWTRPPVWDGDIPFHNWIGHPYAGAFYYNMIRSQGGTIGQSFAFSALQSFLWEYVLESWAEQPSVQDLVSTPIIGSVLGELFHRWSVSLLRKGRLNLGKKALVFFLNPSYVINNGYRPPA